jgi:hypothetical protein
MIISDYMKTETEIKTTKEIKTFSFCFFGGKIVI